MAKEPEVTGCICCMLSGAVNGQVPEYKPCKSCSGKGYVGSIDNPRQCSKCKGEGKIISGWHPCKTCNGTGKVVEMTEVSTSNSIGSTETQSKSDGGCYIATACYGSYDAPDVLILRKYRDQILSRYWWGNLFIKIYYKLSPNLARKIQHHMFLHKCVKKVLNQIVKMLKRKYN